MNSLTAHSDPCGRVWIEDTEHGCFPPDGIHIRFPQNKRKRDVKATLALARKMAAVEELLEALNEAVTNGEWSEGEQCGDWCISKEVYETLRDAIAKAEGVE